MKTIEIKTGEKKRIIKRFSNSLSMRYHFKAEPLSAAENMIGIVEISGSNWVFPKAPVTQELQNDNVVSKSAWDTFFSVYVTPGCDVKISIERSRINHLSPSCWLLWW